MTQYEKELSEERARTIAILEQRIQEFHQENERLRDLVRFCRGQLYTARLITTEEYFNLCADRGAVKRLEGYDRLHVEIERLQDELARLRTETEAA